ncbi:transcription factor MYB27-like [Durio zibethinus]|uniref:Transcription factor MYB27-like n=1 Tax=Durio zibethinus TaxID=66656 RepID=A0A6P6AQU2_DURZI|nr:transcription factor MYB27-like [Durio zibethinus]XP_022767269.1 transcription factor MYB27-like [Durio zibethinus]
MAYETVAAMQGESLRKGPWHEEEDERLITFVKLLGSRRWDYVARASGLKRSGKSCRLRWLNYLRPNIKHGHISAEEEKIILQLHERWGNKWSMIARRLPGRTDNEIKNYCRTHLRKKAVIQEQVETFQFGRDNGKQLFLFQEDGSSSQTCNGESYKPCVDTLDNENGSYETVELSDFALTSSPYQTRLSDWISEFPSDQSEIKSQGESNSTDSLYCYPTWVSYEENDLWGCSGSLWNLE